MAEEREGGIHAPKAVVVVNHGMRVHWYYGYYLPTNCLHLIQRKKDIMLKSLNSAVKKHNSRL